MPLLITGMEQKELSFFDLLEIVIKWRKPLLWLSIVAMLVAAVVVFFIPNEYKATTIFYAGNSQSQEVKNLFDTRSNNADIFGSDGDVDRLMSLSNSSELAYRIINKYKLQDVFEIDSSDKYYRFKVFAGFKDHMDVVKNEYGAVEISFWDVDKERAAKVANDIAAEIDGMNLEIIKESNQKNLSVYEQSYADKLLQVEMLKDSMNRVRAQYGIYNPEVQSELISTELSSSYNTLIAQKARLRILEKNYAPSDTMVINTRATVSGLEERYKNAMKDGGKDFNKGAAIVTALEQNLSNAVDELSYAKDLLQRAKLGSANAPSTLFIIEKASVPEKKDRPKRTIIVLSCGMIVALIGALYALVAELYGAKLSALFKK